MYINFIKSIIIWIKTGIEIIGEDQTFNLTNNINDEKQIGGYHTAQDSDLQKIKTDDDEFASSNHLTLKNVDLHIVMFH